jgi:GntR family transcriptional regulator
MDSSASVDRARAVPLYHQIFLLLRDEIFTGARPFGTVLPTEQQLCETHGVSRITARRSLEELAQHGLVERRRRTGTRVIHRASTRPIEADIDQAVESLLAFGRDTKVRVIEVKTGPATEDVAARLSIAKGDSVVRAVRVRLLEDQPLGEVVSYVPARFGAALDESDLARTPMLALLRAAGHVIGGGEQTISAAVAGGHLANVLGVDDRMPILRIERTVVDAAGTPLLFTVASYRADRYRIAIDLQTSGRVAARTA